MQAILRRISPALVIASVALFAALAGGASALSSRAGCGGGSVRGVAVVNASQSFPDRFRAIGRYNCAGRGVSAKRVDAGVYDVRFAGAGATVAFANVTGRHTAFASVARNPDGSFRVYIRETDITQPDEPFWLVAL